MKLRILGLILACSMLANCVHISDRGLTAFGTDMKNVNYTATPRSKSSKGEKGEEKSESGGMVAFSASEVNNSNSLGKVTNAIMTSVGVWGTVKSIESAGKTLTAQANAKTAQQGIKAKQATDLATIAKDEKIGLATIGAAEAAH